MSFVIIDFFCNAASYSKWQRFNCTRGDDCKFAHEGPGACETVGIAYQGRKFQCLSFKSKGKCSKGSACLFLHVAREKKKSAAVVAGDESAESQTGHAAAKKVGICSSYKKKGKCRKGDRCPYSHDVPSKISNDTSDKKRKRIDGKELVERRTKLNTKVLFDDDMA